jgi:hypothetical protein
MEDVMTEPFMTELDFADHLALKYEQATCYHICQEEERINAAHKAIEMIQQLERGISVPHFSRNG